MTRTLTWILLRVAYIVGGFVLLQWIVRMVPHAARQDTLLGQWAFFGLLFLYLWPILGIPRKGWWAVLLAVLSTPLLKRGLDNLAGANLTISSREIAVVAIVVAVAAGILGRLHANRGMRRRI